MAKYPHALIMLQGGHKQVIREVSAGEVVARLQGPGLVAFRYKPDGAAVFIDPKAVIGVCAMGE